MCVCVYIYIYIYIYIRPTQFTKKYILKNYNDFYNTVFFFTYYSKENIHLHYNNENMEWNPPVFTFFKYHFFILH